MRGAPALASALLLALAAAACGGDDGLAPAPPTLTAGPVTITSDPLHLSIATPTGTVEQDAFVEVATVPSVDPQAYIDPRDLGDPALTWSAPARAIGADPDGALVLDGGVRLRRAAGATADTATLAIDATHVDGAVLTRLVLPLDAPDAGNATATGTGAGTGEPIYGFGETFASADASGGVRELQLRIDDDVESGINEVHAPVPLAMWPRRGLGVFVADRRVGAFDLGKARPGKALATFGLPERGPLTVDLFVAPAPLDLVRRYVSLTARPAVPPRWAFAPQQWRNESTTADVRDDAQQMRALGIPGSTVWIDNPWQTGYNTFDFDDQRYPDVDALMTELRALGYRVVLWSTPYLLPGGATAADYADADGRKLFVRDDRDRTLTFPWKEGLVGLVDFTSPDAVAFWRERIARATARGASGFKLDYGEDVVAVLGGNRVAMRLAGGDEQELHNIFARGYHDAYLGALPPGDGFVITRAGAWGEQDRNTAIWPGDLDHDFSRHGVDNGQGQLNVGGLPAAIAGGLSLSVSGYPFFGSDIGGYRGGAPTAEVLMRWAEYAALGTIMQLGGGGASHDPWDTTQYPAPALAVYRQYARLHMDLDPLLWTLAQAAGADGTPVNRPARFVYPDAACDDLMFMTGDALLVAPVVEPGATTRDVVLPPGRWIDWWTGLATDGDGHTPRTVAAPIDRLPLWRAADRFVPMFARAADTLEPATAAGVTSYADPAYGRELRLVLTPDGGAAETSLHDGARATAGVDGARYHLRFEPGSQYTVATFDLAVAAARNAPAVTAPATVTAAGAPLP
ncbi:MAG TPA: TIM-barrel domain-containing protein, partial [Kofleriaceae bacterium]|nr:TIM-barrel domain-containing protein [Kofleriaceae bacterium]